MRTLKQYLSSEKFIYFTLSILALLSVGLQHGTPYIYFDTRLYIASGMNFEPNYRCSTIYSLFLYFSSLNFSMWFTVLAHAILTAYVLVEALRCFEINAKEKVLFYLCALLSFSSALSYYVCRIMPDFATPLLFVMLYLLLAQPLKFSKIRFTVNSLIFIFLGSSHLSHVAMVPPITLLIFAFNRRYKIPFMRFVLIFILWVIFSAANPISNRVLSGEFKTNKTTYAYLNARLLDHGIMKPHLAKRCAENPKYSGYCRHLSRLPQRGHFFLHNGSAFEIDHVGGKFDDKGYHKHFFWDAMSEPVNIVRFVLGSIVDTGSQLFTFNLNNPTPNNWRRELRNEFFPLETQKSYQHRQDEGHLTRLMSVAQALVILLSIFVYGWLTHTKRLPEKYQSFITFLLISLFVNALTLATLSNVVNRYQARVLWLLPFFILAFFYKIYFEKPAVESS